MTRAELAELIDRARIEKWDILDLESRGLSELPESISTLHDLKILDLECNELKKLPDSIGNLINLSELYLGFNELESLPNSIGKLGNLTKLYLNINLDKPIDEGRIIEMEDWPRRYTPFGSFEACNFLKIFPESITNLTNLIELDVAVNQIDTLPSSIGNLTSLSYLNIDRNPLTDLSILQTLPQLATVRLFGISLPRRYWIKFSNWKPEWLLDEENSEIRRVLIEQVGYEKICEKLNTITIDTWREYTLLKIDGVEKYSYMVRSKQREEPMVLLEMTCPSTGHIHILRVPPNLTSAEAAITWVNHGIHPDEITMAT
jgi:leucine-rich repeat protein SHOC2